MNKQGYVIFFSYLVNRNFPAFRKVAASKECDNNQALDYMLVDTHITYFSDYMISHPNPRQKDFFQKLKVSQRVKKISTIYANRMFMPPSLHKLSPFVLTSTT
jgi:hypothetical protein